MIDLAGSWGRKLKTRAHPRMPPPTTPTLPSLQAHLQQRAALAAACREEEAERARLQGDAAVLARRIAHLDASLEQKRAAQQAFGRVIADAGKSLDKLLESSQLLLAVTKRNAAEVAALSPTAAAGQQGGELAP